MQSEESTGRKRGVETTMDCESTGQYIAMSYRDQQANSEYARSGTTSQRRRDKPPPAQDNSPLHSHFSSTLHSD
ncbi:hypothetical protein ACET3Z_001626 [Daucus carota]